MTMFSRYLRNCPGTRARASSTHFSNSWRVIREELITAAAPPSPRPLTGGEGAEEPLEIRGGCRGDRREVRALDLGELLRGLDDEGRLGGLPAVRNRGAKRGIGLDEHRLERQPRRGLANVLGRAESDHSREG